MFDIGFWELFLVAIVGLLIVGPDKLPGFAREAGHWVRKIRHLARDARREVERELDWDEERETGDLKKRLRHMDRLMKEAPDRQPDYKPKHPEYGRQDNDPGSGSETDPVSDTGTGSRQKPGNDQDA